MDEFKKYEEAESSFLTALRSDPQNIETCEYYIKLLIITRDLSEAFRMISYTKQLKGADLAYLIHKESLVFEAKKKYSQACKAIKNAMVESMDTQFIDFLSDELKRVKNKKKKQNKKNKADSKLN